MPQLEPGMAIKKKLEAPYWAMSEKKDDTALLTEYDISRCLVSNRYQLQREFQLNQGISLV